MGPPGSYAKDIANAIADHFLFDKVCLGTIMKAEAQKSGDLAQQIKQKLQEY